MTQRPGSKTTTLIAYHISPFWFFDFVEFHFCDAPFSSFAIFVFRFLYFLFFAFRPSN
ncbi:unnamed protein product [Meloidogyne enterolobii]|uniref:Uncharacterized protein n=1 Tax=Meloidogyne enterolobii TaxID=390850 RepID=A0ACB1AY67_MELEN